MGSTRKNSGEARGPVVVVVATASVAHADPMQRGKMAGAGVRLRARREILQQIAPQYRSADAERKSELLEAFVQITGYHRKYVWITHIVRTTRSAHRRANSQ
jgi:hypothetical protein